MKTERRPRAIYCHSRLPLAKDAQLVLSKGHIVLSHGSSTDWLAPESLESAGSSLHWAGTRLGVQ